MRRALVAALFLPVALGCWRRTNLMGNQDFFKVVLPAPAVVQVLDKKAHEGTDHELPMRWYRFEEPHTVWLVSATNVETLTLEPEKSLAGMQKGSVDGSRGTLVSQSRLTVNDHPCVDLRIERSDSIVRVRGCITERRLYSLTVQTNEEEARRDEIDRFFSSFSILD